jgi:hypothetical protein
VRAKAARPAKDSDGGRFRDALRHPLAIAAASALVAGWLLPAFAHQWQDRQKERELKRELAIQLDRDATSTVIAAQLLVTGQFPEAQTATVRMEERDATSPGTARDELAAAYDAAVERARVAKTSAHVDNLTEWLVTRSVSISTLMATFPDDDLPNRWKAYANQVTHYVQLASSRAKESDRRKHVDNLIAYLTAPADEEEQWRLLEQQSAELTPKELVDYRSAAGHLAERLLLRKNAFVADLLAAHAAGFSTRPSDLLDDLLPG